MHRGLYGELLGRMRERDASMRVVHFGQRPAQFFPPTQRAGGLGDARLNLPNSLTLCSLGLGVWWAFGGPWWAAVASVVLDEADGRVARARGECTEFGGMYDWGTDMALTALSLGRLGVPWAIPVVTTAQVILRNRGYRPEIGSARAVLMLTGAVV